MDHYTHEAIEDAAAHIVGLLQDDFKVEDAYRHAMGLLPKLDTASTLCTAEHLVGWLMAGIALALGGGLEDLKNALSSD